MTKLQPSIQILYNIADRSKADYLLQAEKIFFQTSTITRAASIQERAAFRARWFGRYSILYPECFLIASRNKKVLGYLAGCTETLSARSNDIVADIPYYTALLLIDVRQFPAHFHVNVAPDMQGQGVGRALISAFENLCVQRGLEGIHVITGSVTPACLFYEACGFVAYPHPDPAWQKLTVLRKVCR